MALATIAKQFTFHAAHRLPNHEGQCRREHGHSYKLEVLVTGDVKAPPKGGASDEGMVLDFSDVKTIYKDRIEPKVEHQNLNKTLAGCVPECATVVGPRGAEYGTVVPLTTCENMASWILYEVKEGLTAQGHIIGPTRKIRDVCVRLWETPTSYAEVGTAPWRG